MNNETQFHSGFVALVGRPNVGKSTLMNALLGEKISIVSAHAQTTRNKITGVWNGENSQVVFLDTPGMHKPQSKLGEVIRQNTMDALDEVDLIVFLCAVNDPLGAGDRYIISLLKDRKVPVILALSKTDLISKDELLKKLVQYDKIYKFAEIVPLSAKTGENLDVLMTPSASSQKNSMNVKMARSTSAARSTSSVIRRNASSSARKAPSSKKQDRKPAKRSKVSSALPSSSTSGSRSARTGRTRTIS